MKPTIPTLMIAGLLIAVFGAAAPAAEVSDAHRRKAQAMLDKAVKHLRAGQQANGSWRPANGPEQVAPAYTALAVAAILRDPQIDHTDPAVRKGVQFLLTQQQPDGGIYDRILANYNTSIVLMALGLVQQDDPKIAAVVRKAQDFLRDLQWAGQQDPKGQVIDKSHPWFGGAGYGNHGRPDLSNTAMMIAGLRDSGLDCKDPAYVRAMEFISRLQGSDANTTLGDKIEKGGGFAYATSTDKDKIETPQSQAGEVIDAEGRSRLRTYGSMTYAGFMSYLYAEMDRDDPRVRDAYEWIRRNYTLKENPNIGMQGYYYYLHLFSRSMAAWGEPTITTADGVKHNWAEELIDRLAELQRPDGTWLNEADRWMEGDTALCTSYAVLALRFALGHE